jgi:hypothetical protein
VRLLGALLLLLATNAGAESIERLEISRDGARYQIELHASLNAPLADAYAVFRDFRNLPKINDAVESVESMPAPSPGIERWRTHVRVCVSVFCSHLKQVQDIRDSRNADFYQLDASVIPAMSNLRYGEAHWQLEHCGAQTCLSFVAALEPDFWVPPLIGPWAIERTMRREALRTAAGIEALALAHRSAAVAETP